jgi:hypothetical protein
MKRLALIAALLALSAAPTRAEPPTPAMTAKAQTPPTAVLEPGKITVRQALALAPALRNLDGKPSVVKQNGTDAILMNPWEFQSGIVRLVLGNDLAIVEPVERAAENARQGIIRELLKKMPAGSAQIAAGTPQWDEYQKQYDQVLDAPAVGTQDLAKIKASDLHLEKNEIPITVIAALKPILEIDK